MANMSSIRLGSTMYDIEDAEARRSASSAESVANAAKTTAETALSNAHDAQTDADSAIELADSAHDEAGRAQTSANNALSVANTKTRMEQTIADPWLKEKFTSDSGVLYLCCASVHCLNIEVTTPTGQSFIKELTLTIPQNARPDNGFYTVGATVNALNNAGTVLCQVREYSKSSIKLRFIAPTSGTFSFDTMLTCVGF